MAALIVWKPGTNRQDAQGTLMHQAPHQRGQKQFDRPRVCGLPGIVGVRATEDDRLQNKCDDDEETLAPEVAA